MIAVIFFNNSYTLTTTVKHSSLCVTFKLLHHTKHYIILTVR